MAGVFNEANQLISDFEAENPDVKVIFTAFAGIDADIEFENDETPRVISMLVDSSEDINTSFKYINQEFIDRLGGFNFSLN